MTARGFTLMELLIVLAILAVLAAIIVAVLNPAEIFRRARDTQRISDFATLRDSVATYVVDASTPNLTANTSTANALCRGGGDTNAPQIYFSTDTTSGCPTGFSCRATSSKAIDGTGWVPVNFSSVSGGSPISSLPQDPSKSANNGANPARYYAYGCDSTTLTFELNTNLESVKESPREANTNDGGDLNTVYEFGSSITILPSSTGASYFVN